MATMDWFGELQRDKLFIVHLFKSSLGQQATEFITKIIQKDQELLDLRSDLVSKLGEVITPIQTLRLFQAERAFKERLVQMLKRQRQKGR